ncbi:fibronectin type III-like domain-contianing protein [Streptomyces sp. GTA36]
MGERAGSEVAQFYVSQKAEGLTRPALQLVGFARTTLQPGEAATLSCAVQVSQLGFTGMDGRFVVEPGPVDVSVGSSSSELSLPSCFRIVGDTTDLEGRRAYLSTASISLLDGAAR